LLRPPGESGNRLWTQAWMRPIFRITRLVRPRVAPTPIAKTSSQSPQKRGYTPSHAHLTLLAWNLFITHVPGTGCTPATVCTADALRWQVELGFKSWKSYWPLAALPTQTRDSTLCSLDGRLLLIVLPYALCPLRRAPVWAKQRRELSLLKLVRPLQAVADRWLQSLFQTAATLRAFLRYGCSTAARLVTKASRKRRTSAERLRESMHTQNDLIELTIKLAA